MNSCSKIIGWITYILCANARPKWSFCALIIAESPHSIVKMQTAITPTKNIHYAGKFSWEDYHGYLKRGLICAKNFWLWLIKSNRILLQGSGNKGRKYSVNLFSENSKMNKLSLSKIYLWEKMWVQSKEFTWKKFIRNCYMNKSPKREIMNKSNNTKIN